MIARRVVFTHTVEDGTRLVGTHANDGVSQCLRGVWEWQSRARDWVHVGSVGKPGPDLDILARTVRALRCIHVTVDLDGIDLTDNDTRRTA